MSENILYRIYEWYISRNLKPEKMPKHVAIIMDETPGKHRCC